MPSKKKRPAPLDLSIVHQDAQLVTLSAKTLPQNNQPKKKKRGPYDPEVYQAVEQIRQEVEEDEIVKRPTKRKKREPPAEALDILQQLEKEADQLDQAIQQMTPVNTPVKAVKECYQLLEEGQDPPRMCPFHMELIGPVVNNKGYQLSRCTDQPCLIKVFNDDDAKAYLQGVYTKIHKDIHDHWGQLLCYCQPTSLPGLRQSKSEHNMDRMYLACRNHQCKFFHWADEPLADPADVMTCPRHLKKMEERTAKTGWEYLRCPAWTCFLFCGKQNGEKYMSAVRKNIHPDVCDRWEKITCLCGNVPILKQSFSDKNPDRLYLACGNNNRCKFFRWADVKVDKENFKDPLAVQDWLNTIPDLGQSYNGKEIKSPWICGEGFTQKPTVYGEGLTQAEQRLQQTILGRQNMEIVESDPPVYVPLHKDVIERGKLGLF